MIIQANNFGQPWYALFTTGPSLPVNPNKGHIHVTAETYSFGGVVYSQSEPSDHTKFWCKTTVSNDYAILGQMWWDGAAANNVDYSRIEFGCDGVYKWDGSAWTAATGAVIYDGNTWKPVTPTIVDLSEWVLTTNKSDYGSGSYKGGVLTLTGRVHYGGAADSYWSSYTTNGKIDLTSYSQVKAHIISAESSSYMFVKTNRGDRDTWLSGWIENASAKVSIAPSNNGTDIVMDVSGLSGQYYLGFVVDGVGEVKSNKVWLS